MAIGNVELLHSYFLKHLRKRIRMKHYKDTEEVGNKRQVNMERSTAGTKKSPNNLAIARSYHSSGIKKLKINFVISNDGSW